MNLQLLFVDDEPNVLDGLRRTLRGFRHEWDMRFAPGGAAALAALQEAPADVVVSDMRMPGMNGDEFLGEVRRRFPQTVRIVLTGECAREAMARVTALAHRVLTKPCDADELKAAIQQAFALRGLLLDRHMSEVVGRLQSVPSKPDLYGLIRSALEEPNHSLEHLGEICARDVGVSAKLMQLANSALFGTGKPVLRAFEAVARIGAELTRALVLTEGILTAFDPRSIHPFSIDCVWAHSQAASVLAARIAEREAGGAPWLGLVPAAGTLHDIGRLILASTEPESYVRVLRLAQEGRLTLVEAETRVFGATHATIGAYLLGLWGVPSAIVEAVAWHHTPATCPADRFGLVTAVHAAAGVLRPDDGGVDTEYLARLGLADRLPTWSRWAAASAEGVG